MFPFLSGGGAYDAMAGGSGFLDNAGNFHGPTAASIFSGSGPLAGSAGRMGLNMLHGAKGGPIIPQMAAPPPQPQAGIPMPSFGASPPGMADIIARLHGATRRF